MVLMDAFWEKNPPQLMHQKTQHLGPSFLLSMWSISIPKICKFVGSMAMAWLTQSLNNNLVI